MPTKAMKSKFKNWIYSKFLSQDIQQIRQVAYDKGYDHGKNEFQDELDWRVNQKYTEVNWLVNPDSVLTVDQKGRAFLLGRELSDIEAKELKSEAKALMNLKIWKIMQETLRQKAIEKMALTSTGWEEVLTGKAMIHGLGIIKSIAELMADYKF